MERVLMKLMSVVWRAVMKMLFVHIAWEVEVSLIWYQ
jgi:hypothetical protein